MKFTDQLNRTITLKTSPKRIISLVPSQTELLFDLGLQEKIVGITKFCIHPKQACKATKKVGGTKNINFERIEKLQPDLIIANKEENQKEQIEELAKKYPVWISDIKTIEQALDMIENIGVLVEESEKAQKIIQEINLTFTEARLKIRHQKKVAYLIWQNPYMTIGQDTFIHDILQHFGFLNVFQDQFRYPETTLEELKQKKIDYLFLSSEPFPFKNEHVQAIQKEFKHTKVLIIDGEMCSWYGSRLLYTVNYFNSLDI